MSRTNHRQFFLDPTSAQQINPSPPSALFHIVALRRFRSSACSELLANDLQRGYGHAATNVRGLYVAGNVRGGIHRAIFAAAKGAEAAIAINEALHDEARR
jgi:hypothetical protein